jgi:prepilin-type N-terminal cleavage/methylation domain-containing protein
MKKNSKKKILRDSSGQKNKYNAFSLIELAVTITIISVVIAGFLSVTIGSNINNKVKLTRDRINKIYKALGTYVLVNQRIPCPASLEAIKSSDATYGNEGGTAGSCSVTGVYASTTNSGLIYGMVPVRALLLPNDFAEDGFGNKIVYIVGQQYTSSTTFSSSGTAMTIQRYANSALTTEASNAIFVIISYGANQYGAFGSKSATQNSASADTDEKTNAITSLNDSAKTGVFSGTFTDYTERSTIFDDIIFYKSRNNFLMDSRAIFLTNSNINH